jgi:L-lysine 6-transaminase
MGVIDSLKKHILVDGFHVVVDTEKSHGSWIVDAETGKEYLDCYSQFASQPLGWNHPYLKEREECFKSVGLHKLANSDCYSQIFADFVDKFAEVTPDFKYYFFIDGGGLAVENALKAAFDWKHQKSGTHPDNMDVIHFTEAFHGRTGYTMSLTNNGGPDEHNIKIKHFPTFKWTRVLNPKRKFPIDDEVQKLESQALDEIAQTLWAKDVAAIIIEPIQGEGGDNHFRKEFFVELRALADKYEALLIFDEVQCGMGLTGKMWCYEHFGIIPDLMCFGKKTQVCGFCSTGRIDEVPDNVFHVSGRINSTWGGNIVDMLRAKIILQAMGDLHLVERAKQTGDYFLKAMQNIKSSEVSNVRGRGLMLALDLPSTERREEVIHKLNEHMLVLRSGTRSLRFRPVLTFNDQNVNRVADLLTESLS